MSGFPIYTYILIFAGVLVSCDNGDIIVANWPDGTVKERRHYLPDNDREDGHYKVWFYYESGKLESEGFKVDGKKNGEWTEYYENGNLKLKGNFREDIKVGEFKEYYEDSILKAKYSYNGVGVLHEDYSTFNELGNTIEKGRYENGIKMGLWVYYEKDTDDHIIKRKIDHGDDGFDYWEWIYLDPEDESYFEFIARDRERNIDSIGRFANGLKDGFWKIYGQDSNYVKMEGAFNRGLKTGLWHYNMPEFHIKKEVLYENDVEKLISYQDGNKQTVKNGDGYVTYSDYEPRGNYLYVFHCREIYKNGELIRKTRKVVFKEKL